MNYRDRLIRSDHVWSDLLENNGGLIAQQIVAGGAAGNISVSGIKRGDVISSVISLGSNKQTTAAGGAAGDITVTGIAATDRLVSVINLADGLDLTSEFSITAADTINNTGGSATTGDRLLVTWKTPNAELTSEFTITSDGVINNASGTASTGTELLVTYEKWQPR